MVNMPPVAAASRSLLNSPKSHHLCFGLYSPSRGIGRASIAIPFVFHRGINSQSYHSRQFSAVERGSVPRFKEQSGPNQIASNNKRSFASQAGPGEVSEGNANISIDFAGGAEAAEGAEEPSIRLKGPTRISFINAKGEEEHLLLNHHWLRDACECNMCVDPDSGQKNFSSFDVPKYLVIKKISKTKDGGLEVVWENDFLSSGDHVSHYSPEAIKEPSDRQRKYSLPMRTLWDKATFERDRRTIDYEEWMAGGQGFLSGLHQLRTHGLLFLRNVPSSEESVISIANQIGNLQETFYGRTWDVRSKPNAENVAYTNSFLGLHQDLLYMNDPPRVQILHCLENTCEGGDSMFSDGLRASQIMKQVRHRLYFLRKRLVRYHYKKNGHYYEKSRPLLDWRDEIIFWSPPFQASRQPPLLDAENRKFYRNWLKVALKLRHLLEDEQWVYQYKMQPGECVLFDNLRVLHGRKKFDAATGSRWLKGAYVADDVLRSKCATLSQQLLELGQGNEAPLSEQAIRFNDEYKLWEPKVDEEQDKKP
ncbi:Clavaminate synthase-like protein [Hypoxylon sp. FL1857]|nr:Clavaminate synthase-like protein [Hypoxylon sp. FL1857]